MMKKHLTIFMACLVLCAIVQAQDAMSIAVEKIKNSKGYYGLQAADLNNWLVTDHYTSKKSGVTNIYIQQRYQGIVVPSANINIHITRKGEVLHMRNNFIPNLEKAVKNSSFSLSADQAIRNAASHHDLTVKDLRQIETRENDLLFNEGGISMDPIPAKKILHQVGPKELRAAWLVSIYTLDAQHRWDVKVDAATGDILQVEDGVIHCSFGHANHVHCNEEEQAVAHNLAAGHAAFKQTNNPDSYNVFPITIESPNHGSRNIEINPADAVASPYGWHDTDGATGGEYTITRGNNVLAQDDQNGNNGSGYSPDGDASLDFDFPFDPSGTAAQNLDASITNLFYWSNIMHDVYYQYGFDEASGNFQQNNYGRGGAGTDYVFADGLDGSGTNNANFSTPPDGENPRMQMFLWSGGGSVSTFNVNSPAPVSGVYVNGAAAFGPTTFDVTGELVDAVDNSANPSEVCNAVANAGTINGKIAMIDRGTCNFSEKVYNAQLGGAIAVVICNNATGGVIAMAAGTNAGNVTIPSVMLSLEDCANIRLQTGVNATMTGSPLPNELDGSFDNGIIAHEYGHGISTRLTGGPSQGCLGGSEQMGEGWSDFFGLALTVLPNQNAETPRGIGTYAGGQGIGGNGIRTYQYSRDMAVNPHTYDDIKSEVVPHGVGSVWCVMLWDMYWDLVDIYGYDTDLYNGTGGNNIAMHLVIEGCKLQGCAPGFVDGRDAILAADQALYGGVNECTIWEAFARRGLGASASQGSSASQTDGTEAFDLPAELLGATIIKTASVTETYEGGTITFNLETSGSCFDASNINISDELPSNLTYVNGSASDGGSFGGNTVSYPALPNLASGNSVTYTLQATVNGGIYFPTTTPLNDNLEGGGGNWTSAGATANRRWVLSNSPNCGSNSYFAENFGISSEQTLTLNTQIPTTGLPTLSFDHYYDTEATWDGGVVEFSIDNGSTWTDAGDYFTANGYNAKIAGNAATAIEGRPSFTGASGGCITSTIRLCDFLGESIRIRFLFAEDANTNLEGWYIDNIQLTDEAVIRNSATVTTNTNTDSDAICIKVIEAPAAIQLDAKVFLGGSYNGSINTDNIRMLGFIPLNEPYTALGYTNVNGGGETVESTILNATGNDAIVDWVFTELRDANDPTTVLATRTALLQSNGNIVDLDGSSPVSFVGMADGNYYVAIHHRNHLAVMTAAPVALATAGGAMVDFTDPATATYGTNAQQNEAGVMCLWAGDASNDGAIDASDRSDTWNARNQTAYISADLDMDGTCDASDRSTAWNNRNKTAQLP